MVGYVGDHYSDANFSEIWLSGEFPAKELMYALTLVPATVFYTRIQATRWG